ncbi:hypothetical protein FHG87_011818 [Trinorchestia longiramus]|nr:hypothetical protein FHG87_011818 [Trinorchestia longiramus]
MDLVYFSSLALWAAIAFLMCIFVISVLLDLTVDALDGDALCINDDSFNASTLNSSFKEATRGAEVRQSVNHERPW